MSDNQMVKIVFDFDLGNVPASAKKFSQYLKDINVNLEFTKKSVEGVGNSVQQTAQKIDNASNSVKKSNQQWTNFALILQDLPYGFRGIQNNLPAVIGGIAGAAGPIYLLSSAVIAFFTAVDNGMIKFGNSTKTSEGYSKSFASTLAEETTKMDSLYRVSTDTNRSMSDRLEAAKELKKEYPGLLDKYSAEQIALGNAKDGYIELTKIISMYAKAKAAEKMIIDITAKSLENEFKINKIIADAGPEPRRFQGNRTTSAYLLYQAKIFNQTKDLKEEQAQLSIENQYYNKILDDNVNAMSRLSSAQDNGKKSNKKLEDSTIGLLRAKQQYYKDDVIMYAAYEQEILKREEGLAIKQAQLDGKSASDIENIHKTYEQLRINSAEVAGNKILEVQKKLGQEEGKELEKIAKEAADAAKKIDDRNLQNSLTALKLESEVATKIANSGGKATAGDRIKILEDYKNKLYDLASVGGYTADQFDKINDAIVNVDAAIAGSTDKVKDFKVSWTETINGINGVIMDFINNSMYALGESIGKSLAGENVDAINVFGNLLADALQSIGKQLIAFATASLFAWALLTTNNPVTAALALAAGIAAVAAGAAMKSNLSKGKGGHNTAGSVNSNPTKKFANGGIISGPTYGLMGEYPGAKSNPEVVAPLDKLKDLMGGGNGGTFLLRGQDLLLSVNRAQKASNLKGQNISLA
jgi:hypothetical protein